MKKLVSILTTAATIALTTGVAFLPMAAGAANIYSTTPTAGWPGIPGYGPVTALVDSVHRILYVGGIFTQVGSTPRNNIAAINMDTGEVLPFNPDISGSVTGMALSSDGSILYV